MTLRVELVSPEQVLYSGDASMVVARTAGGGDIAFLTGHAPFLGVLEPGGGERDRLVGGAGDVAVALEPPDHLVHGRRRELHRARHVGAGHGQPGLLQPEDRLQVLLFGNGRVRHRG